MNFWDNFTSHWPCSLINPFLMLSSCNLDAANVVGIKSFYDRCCISSTHFRLFDSFFQRQYADLVMDPLSQSLDHPNNNSTNLTNLQSQGWSEESLRIACHPCVFHLIGDELLKFLNLVVAWGSVQPPPLHKDLGKRITSKQMWSIIR